MQPDDASRTTNVPSRGGNISHRAELFPLTDEHPPSADQIAPDSAMGCRHRDCRLGGVESREV
jgi:hypothetical protein